MTDATRSRSKPEANSPPPAFPDLCSLAEFQAANAKIFPSVPSLRWFYRQHRDELLKAGAVVELAGRLQVNGPIFAKTALAIGQRTAADRGDRSGGD